MENEQELKKGEEKKEKKREPKPPDFYQDFGNEIMGSYCLILLPNNETLEGKVLESRKFFLKVQVKNDILYINKAHVIYVMPLHKKA
jgi:hypothetical protein